MSTRGSDHRVAAVIGSGSEFFLPYNDDRSQPVDLNGPMITNALAKRGVSVIHQSITPDDIELQVAELRHARSIGANMFVTNAGTGTSADDTMWRVISQVTGRPLVFRPELRQLVAPRQRALGAEDEAGFRAAVNKLSALPEGAVWLPPPGTAAPFLLIVEDECYMSTPGPWVEARPALMALLEHDQAQAWMGAAAPLQLLTARFFDDVEVAINQALRAANDLGLTEGLDIITCVTHGGAESDIQMQIRHDQERTAAQVISFVQERIGVTPFSKGETLDQLTGSALDGRTTRIYGAGPAAAEMYLRLWGRAPVEGRLFRSSENTARFAARRRRGLRHGAAQPLVGEELVVSIAQHGLATDRPDFAVAIAGRAPAWACVAGRDGQLVTARLSPAMEHLTDVPDTVLTEAQDDFFAHKLMCCLFKAAQQ